MFSVSLSKEVAPKKQGEHGLAQTRAVQQKLAQTRAVQEEEQKSSSDNSRIRTRTKRRRMRTTSSSAGAVFSLLQVKTARSEDTSAVETNEEDDAFIEGGEDDDGDGASNIVGQELQESSSDVETSSDHEEDQEDLHTSSSQELAQDHHEDDITGLTSVDHEDREAADHDREAATPPLAPSNPMDLGLLEGRSEAEIPVVASVRQVMNSAAEVAAKKASVAASVASGALASSVSSAVQKHDPTAKVDQGSFVVITTTSTSTTTTTTTSTTSTSTTTVLPSVSRGLKFALMLASSNAAGISSRTSFLGTNNGPTPSGGATSLLSLSSKSLSRNEEEGWESAEDLTTSPQTPTPPVTCLSGTSVAQALGSKDPAGSPYFATLQTAADATATALVQQLLTQAAPGQSPVVSMETTLYFTAARGATITKHASGSSSLTITEAQQILASAPSYPCDDTNAKVEVLAQVWLQAAQSAIDAISSVWDADSQILVNKTETMTMVESTMQTQMDTISAPLATSGTQGLGTTLATSVKGSYFLKIIPGSAGGVSHTSSDLRSCLFPFLTLR
ncbi:unnamed protein product [Amoebophrya sp. A25]|nr:unnamed protein product [Amoebophrya sp. A25]|eukprot:GSA25T00017971001.1